MRLTVEEVVGDLNKLIEFLEPVHSLANSHFVSIFTENLWSQEIPLGIQEELKDRKSLNNFIQFYPEIVKNNCSDDFIINHPNLWKFISTVINILFTNEKKYSIFEDLENFLADKGCIENCDFFLEEFMSKKKLHEVKITSKITATLSNLTKSTHIVDVGGGKGYLSSILALHHRLKVLGLDSSEVTTCGAMKRSEKVAKLWNGTSLSGDSREKAGKKAKEEFIKRHYKQVITFVRPETDVGNLLREHFKEETDGITLTGLHTCGDLASTCLKMFLNNNEIKAIVNVGCCYHLISEEFPEEGGGGGGSEGTGNHGFPMSSYLRGRRFSLGRNARMLAAHSLSRMSSKSEWESSQTSLFYRAVLETIIQKEDITRRDNVGKLAKKCNNFHEYVSKALKKLGADSRITEEEANQLLESFREKKPMMTAFFLLRVTLAPVVESIILLDRILYLLEKGVENAFLVRLFDLEISPRGFGIVAWKDFDTR